MNYLPGRKLLDRKLSDRGCTGGNVPYGGSYGWDPPVRRVVWEGPSRMGGRTEGVPLYEGSYGICTFGKPARKINRLKTTKDNFGKPGLSKCKFSFTRS